MTGDMFTATVEATEVIGLLDRLAQSADFVCLEVARDTARRIVSEAQRRIRRATGETAGEIHFELTRDGKGYVVLGYQEGIGDFPIDKYLEWGTKFQSPHKFFFSSAQLEEGPHLRRLTDRIQEWLDEVGR